MRLNWCLIVTPSAHFSHLSLCLFLAPSFFLLSLFYPFFHLLLLSPPPTRFLAVLGSRPPCLTSRLMCVCECVCLCSVCGCVRAQDCVSVCFSNMSVCVSSCSLDVVSSPVFVFLLRPADLFSQECYCYCCHTVNTHSLFLCSSPLFSPPLSLHLFYFSLCIYLHISTICLFARLSPPPLSFHLPSSLLFFLAFERTQIRNLYFFLSPKRLIMHLTSTFLLPLSSSCLSPLLSPFLTRYFSSCRQSCLSEDVCWQKTSTTQRE